MRFADLHCHPTGKLFAEFSVKSKKRLAKPTAHPWNMQEYNSNAKKLAKGKRATKYSQSDFARLTKGKVKLVYASLYPFEQGFLNKVNYEKLQEVLDDIDFENKYNLDDDVIDYDNYRKASIADVLAAKVLNLRPKRVDYIRSDDYDYYKELLREYNFILKRSGIEENTQVYIDQSSDESTNNNAKVDEKLTHVRGRYWLLSNKNEGVANVKFKKWQDRNQIFTSDNDDIGVVLTIEGMSALSMYNQAVPVPEKLLFDRIDALKKWDPPIFFITFSHHFDNNLAAHAHSMPELLGPIDIIDPDQSKNMNHIGDNVYNGINDLGLRVIKELLNIENGETGLRDSNVNVHRILIDVKHMSASARKDYYEKIIDLYNNHNQNKIPIIASHVGYSGVRDLQQMILSYDDETNYSDSATDFNNWNINLSDEDVAKIIRSEGLIGICFEQRILGVDGGILGSPKVKNSAKVLANNIKGFADAVRTEGLHKYGNGYSIWDVLCIGTDNDGGIDPLDDYPTSAEFPEMLMDLKGEINSWPDKSAYGINNDNIDEVLEKFAFSNSFNFLEKHWGK